MNRQECLDKASEIIHHDRNSEYGEPEDNFGDIAAYWTTYLRKKLKDDAQITTPDVAVMSALIKVSRLQNTPGHEDSWTDIAGYAACGVQCATEIPTRYINEGEFEVEGPVLMYCGCPLAGNNLVDRGNAGLSCANCGYHYPWPEKKEE